MMKILHTSLSSASVAVLTFALPAFAQTPPTLALRLFAGVNITGTVGSVYAVQSTADLAQTNSWQSIAFVQLPTTKFLFVDTTGPASGNRFYRARLQTPP